jgi:hypothetical protein
MSITLISICLVQPSRTLQAQARKQDACYVFGLLKRGRDQTDHATCRSGSPFSGLECHSRGFDGVIKPLMAIQSQAQGRHPGPWSSSSPTTGVGHVHGSSPGT